MLTTAEAAAALGVTRRQVLKLIKEEKLKATRFGVAWQVEEVSVMKYQQERRKAGWVKGRRRSV